MLRYVFQGNVISKNALQILSVPLNYLFVLLEPVSLMSGVHQNAKTAFTTCALLARTALLFRVTKTNAPQVLLVKIKSAFHVQKVQDAIS